ncbi:MAG: formylglycine-generating enzyme family protein [Hyphomicrobiaceae bacterium]
MSGDLFGAGETTREILAYATVGVSGLVLIIAAWRAMPDGMARWAAVAAIALGVAAFDCLHPPASANGLDRMMRTVAEHDGTVITRSTAGSAGAAQPEKDAATRARDGSSGSGMGWSLGRTLASLVGIADAASVGYRSRPFRDCAHCPEMRMIRPGYLELGAEALGSRAAATGVRVRVGYPFAISAGEIRSDEWQAFASATGRAMPLCPDGSMRFGGAAPIACITQAEALAYAAWLVRETGRRYRLASEAEWELAARAGSSRRFWSGLVAPQVVDGTTPANPNGLVGLHDRFGERVADCWARDPGEGHADGRALAIAGCTTGVVKDLDATGARASAGARLPLAHAARDPRVGLRIVVEID